VAYRCNVGNHTNCEACTKPISPADKDHCHIYRGGRYGVQCICGDCWIVTAACGVQVLTALKAAGIRWEDPFAVIPFIRQHVAIGVDLALFDPDEHAN
jgi:hypothetical protein